MPVPRKVWLHTSVVMPAALARPRIILRSMAPQNSAPQSIARGKRYLSNDLKSWLHNLIADRVPNKLGGRREVEFTHDGGAVRFNGLEADVQETGDLLVGVTLCDQLDYATFPVRQSRPLPRGI